MVPDIRPDVLHGGCGPHVEHEALTMDNVCDATLPQLGFDMQRTPSETVWTSRAMSTFAPALDQKKP